MDLFVELIRVALRKQDSLSRIPDDYEWIDLYRKSCRQTLVGVAFHGIELLPQEQCPPKALLLKWLAHVESIKKRNELMNERVLDVSSLFSQAGYKSCVLKGQGLSLLYNKFSLGGYRMPGDIDLWVDGDREEIIQFLKSRYEVGSIVIHHVDTKIFNDVETEIHFLPSYTYSPVRFRKYIKFFDDSKSECFALNGHGYASPPLCFNLIYLMLHIFRHIYNEGIGLRQLLDYYLVLTQASSSDKVMAMKTLEGFGLSKVTAAVMYVLREVFGASQFELLCSVDERYGSFLLREIEQSGNFGQYDKRLKSEKSRSMIRIGMTRLCRMYSFILISPSEVFWAPFWKLWHWWWRKYKGYC